MVSQLNNKTVTAALCSQRFVSECLAAAPVVIVVATHHFVLFTCGFKFCSEIAFNRMFAYLLFGLNGKSSLRAETEHFWFVFPF